MVFAYVLVLTEAGKEECVYKSLDSLNEVTDLHPLFGEYDIIAKIEPNNVYDNKDPDDLSMIGCVVVDKIRTIPGVVDTKTLTGKNI